MPVATRSRVRFSRSKGELYERALKGDRRAELVRDMGGKPFAIIERWRLGGRTARRRNAAAVRPGAAQAV